jgi:uncharacterized protein
MQNAINWFEIPVSDLDRAVAFYEAVLGVKLRREVFGGRPMAIFPYSDGGVGGALLHDPRRAPSADGSILYLHVGDRLEQALASAKQAHGEVVLPKTHIGDPGHIGIVRDTEGNLVGLHAPPAGSASMPGAASAA